MSGSSSGTARPTSTGSASLLSDSVDRLPVVSVDPGEPVGLAVQGVVIENAVESSPVPEGFWDRVAPSNDQVPWRDRLAFWQRVKARRAERVADRAREDQDISMWLAEKAPTRTELIAQDTVDLVRWEDNPVIYLSPDNMPELQLGRSLDMPYNPAPISSARRTHRQVETLETIDVGEVFWDIATMIDAHRNGATALERPIERFFEKTPVWDELTKIKYDPTHEMGPRERDYVRKLAKS